MEQKEVFVSRGSIELVVIGLLAALVVLIAFPMITGFSEPEPPLEANKVSPTNEKNMLSVD
jgi:hypothetical protein